MSFTPVLCQQITTAPATDKIHAGGDHALATLMAHITAMRGQLENIERGQEQLREVVSSVNMRPSPRSAKSPNQWSHHGYTFPNGQINGFKVPEEKATNEMPGTRMPDFKEGEMTKPPKPVEEGIVPLQGSDPLDAQLSSQLNELVNRQSIVGDVGDNTKARLKIEGMVAVAEQEEARLEAEGKQTMWYKLRHMTKEQKNLFADALTGILVTSNVLVIAISCDLEDESGGRPEILTWVDVAFTVGFCLELMAKIYIDGCRGYFRSFGAFMDFAIVAFDIISVALNVVNVEALDPSILRIVRLARLTRIARVLRLSFSKDLVRMTTGFSGCLSTLFWSGFLFCIAVMVVALAFRESLGRLHDEELVIDGFTGAEYFNSVPRAALTIFRCSFGDCATHGGTPIFEHVTQHHGVGYTFIYGLFLFGMSIGLFNVISAIFVESTMTVAKEHEKGQKQKRLQNDKLWATRITTLIRAMMRHTDPESLENHLLSELIENVMELTLTPEMFDKVVQDPEAGQALDELDISKEDHRYLSDILDPDNSGAVSVAEIVQGLESLRGEPRRSDIVAVDLMVRSIQSQLQDIGRELRSLKDRMKDQLELMSKLIRTEISHHRTEAAMHVAAPISQT